LRNHPPHPVIDSMPAHVANQLNWVTCRDSRADDGIAFTAGLLAAAVSMALALTVTVSSVLGALAMYAIGQIVGTN
jgi:hypothetical protein